MFPLCNFNKLRRGFVLVWSSFQCTVSKLQCAVRIRVELRSVVDTIKSAAKRERRLVAAASFEVRKIIKFERVIGCGRSPQADSPLRPERELEGGRGVKGKRFEVCCSLLQNRNSNFDVTCISI